MTTGHAMAFAVETVPDVEFGRRLHGLEGLTDKQVGYVMQTRQREQTGSEYLSLEQHRIVAIAVTLRTDAGVSVAGLGEADTTEAGLIRHFLDAVARHRPTLVSWNGRGYELPVLRCRALRHCLASDPGQRGGDPGVAFGRPHVALRDELSGERDHGGVGLDALARLLGLPGQRDQPAERAWQAHLEGRIDDLRQDCAATATSIYLVHLRCELLRGRLTRDEHDRECGLVRRGLAQSGVARLEQYLADWTAASG